jgi:ATP-binding cassette subfamily F protein 3
MGSQRTAEAKGRQKKLENLVRLQRPYDDVRRPNIPAPKVDRGGEMVLETRGLAGGYGTNRLFDKLDLRIGRGQRIGVVGPNGAGKTTLLKILAGHAEPLAGSIEFGHKAVCGFYDQDTSGLRVDGTPMTELRRERPEMTDLEVRSYLARFLFRGEQVEKPVSALSGGERARLCLAKLLSKSLTWLAMDEPTNHLDLAARTSLEELLGDFDGALVCVSHDREFLDGLCTHILEVGDGQARLYSGNYSDWRAAKLGESAVRAEQREDAKIAAKKLERQAAAAAQAKPSSKPAPAGKVRNPWAFERLEKRIIELEEERAKLHAEVVTEDVYRNAPLLREKQMRIAEVEMELERSNEEWMNW